MSESVDNWRDRWLDVVDWYDENDGRRKVITAVVVLALLAAIGFWQFRPDSGSESLTTGSGSVVENAGAAPGGAADVSSTARATSTTEAPTASTADEPTGSATAPSTPAAGAGSTVAPGDASATPAAGSSTTIPPAAGAPSTSVASAAPAGGPQVPYPTSPDGSPLPVVVVFDTDTITISGQVPSQAAKDRLAGLAQANSQFPEAVVVDNMVINPAVPISVGVRVIELNSVRFPEGTADILPPHALELDRVANIMRLLPNISVLVVGHADQRGDELTNFAISDERARAVVNYLIYLGISPARLSSRAAGEADLLAIGDDDASLALNRRTEFIFGGLLIE